MSTQHRSGPLWHSSKSNDVMRTELAAGDYRALFDARLARGDPGARTIEGFRYVRNVGQHLLHPVVPEAGGVVGSNLGLGFRSWSHWAGRVRGIPTHLHTPTRKLEASLRPSDRGKIDTRSALGRMQVLRGGLPATGAPRRRGRVDQAPLRPWGTSRINCIQQAVNPADRSDLRMRFVDGSIYRPPRRGPPLDRCDGHDFEWPVLVWSDVSERCLVFSSSPNRSPRSRRTSRSGTSTGVVSRRGTLT